MSQVKQNPDIRGMIAAAQLKQWQVAEAIGISEVTFIRWLRKPLTALQRERTIAAIDRLKTD